MTRVFPVGDYCAVEYDVIVADSSSLTVEDIAQWFEFKTGLTGFLGDTDVLLRPPLGKSGFKQNEH